MVEEVRGYEIFNDMVAEIETGKLTRSGPCCSTVIHFDPPLDITMQFTPNEPDGLFYRIAIVEDDKTDGMGENLHEAASCLAHEICFFSTCDPNGKEYGERQKKLIRFLQSRIKKFVWSAPDNCMISNVNQISGDIDMILDWTKLETGA